MTDDDARTAAARDTFAYQTCEIGVAVARLLLALAVGLPMRLPHRDRMIAAARTRLERARDERDDLLAALTV